MSSEHSNRDADLPSGWERVPLREIAEINPGLEIRIEDDEEHVNFVPMRAVEPEGAGLLRPEVRTYGEVKKGYTVFRSGDVITAKITPCMENGKTTVVPELPDSICFGSTEFHVIRPETGVDPRWISNFLLQHEIRRLAQRSMAGGVGQMRVPGSFVEELNIPVPPQAEVQRIFAELDELLPDLDKAVASLERVQEKLALYRAAVLKVAIEGNLTAEWRHHHPALEPAAELLNRVLDARRNHWEEEQLRKFAHAGTVPQKNWKAKYREPVGPDVTHLPTLPKEWCWASLDQLSLEIRNGCSIKPSAEKGVPILRISAVRPLSLNLDDVRYLSDKPEYEEFRVESGDILFTRYNGTKSLVAVCAVVPALSSVILHPDKLIRARLVNGINGQFIAIAANVRSSRQFLEARIRTTAGQAGVSGSDLRQMPVPLAPLAEQEIVAGEVADQLSIIEHLETDLQSKLKGALAIRESVMQRSFNGQLVAQHLTDEPASELMKRIAAAREQRAGDAKAAKNAGKNEFRKQAAVKVRA